MKCESLGKARYAYTMRQSPLEVGGMGVKPLVRHIHLQCEMTVISHTHFGQVSTPIFFNQQNPLFLDSYPSSDYLIWEHDHLQFLQLMFWLHKNLYLSQVWTRLQKPKNGDNKIFKPQLSIFLSQCKQDLSLASQV